MKTTSTSAALRHGVICDIALSAGIQIRHPEKKCPIRCCFHEDQNASAFLDPATNVFFCSVCTPGGGLSAKQFAEKLGVSWPPSGAFEQAAQLSRQPHVVELEPSFTPNMAERVWDLARDRARDDAFAEADAEVYAYLRGRGLGESWEHSLFGILGADMSLPAVVAGWPSRDYRLIAPTYGEGGNAACIQARAIGDTSPRTLSPTGSRVKGTVFANAHGIEVLRRSWNGRKRVILGEGLTDHLALSTVSPVPVMCAPGTGMAASSIGSWVEGFELFIALDWDEAGDAALGPTAERAYELGAKQVRRIEWPRGCNDACDVVDQVGLDGLATFLSGVLVEVSR
jgi:hypothetical protein